MVGEVTLQVRWIKCKVLVPLIVEAADLSWVYVTVSILVLSMG